MLTTFRFRFLCVLAVAVVALGIVVSLNHRDGGVHSPSQADLRERLAKISRNASMLEVRDVSANHRLLASVKMFPSARFVRQFDNPVTLGPPQDDLAFQEYVGKQLSQNAYLRLSADVWTSERDYEAPRHARADVVKHFFVSRLRGDWRLLHFDSARGLPEMRRNGIGFYDVALYRKSYCLHVRIGGPLAAMPRAGRSIELAVSRSPMTNC
jgi:hypothetical protein